MPRATIVPATSALNEPQAKLVADAATARKSVQKLARRLVYAVRPRAATVRALAEAAARLAWQSDLLAQWLQEEARCTASLRQHEQRQSAAAERRADLFLAELEAHVPSDAFEKQFCHPADLVEARALEMFQA